MKITVREKNQGILHSLHESYCSVYELAYKAVVLYTNSTCIEP